MNEGRSEGVNVDKFGHGAPNSCQNECKRLVIRAIIGHKFGHATLEISDKVGEVTLNTCQNKGKCMSSEQQSTTSIGMQPSNKCNTVFIRAIIGHKFGYATLDNNNKYGFVALNTYQSKENTPVIRAIIGHKFGEVIL